MAIPDSAAMANVVSRYDRLSEQLLGSLLTVLLCWLVRNKLMMMMMMMMRHVSVSLYLMQRMQQQQQQQSKRSSTACAERMSPRLQSTWSSPDCCLPRRAERR